MRSPYKLGSAAVAMTALLAAPVQIHNSAYANTLNALIPDLYAALDVVSRELVGFIPSVNRNASAERAAVGQSVRYDVAPAMAGYDTTPAMNVPEPPDVTIPAQFMQITKSRAVPFGFTGEEQRGLNAGGGPGYLSAQAGLFAQALRTLVNELEVDVAVEAAANASRAYGTPGTTPFLTGTADTAQVRKILDDNGAPLTGRSLVINTTAGAAIRSNPQFNKVNEAGTQMTLRQGELLDIHGFSVKESHAAVNFVKGSAAAPTTNGAGYGVGATTINLAAASTGAIKAGDVISFAGDSNKYVVESGDTSVADGGSIKISAPGLRVAIPAAATAITLSPSYAANVAFADGAIQLVARAPAFPVEGDLALDRLTITDVRSGMTFEVSVWPGYRKVRLEVALAWGVKAVKREHIALLLG